MWVSCSFSFLQGYILRAMVGDDSSKFFASLGVQAHVDGVDNVTMLKACFPAVHRAADWSRLGLASRVRVAAHGHDDNDDDDYDDDDAVVLCVSSAVPGVL